jgi:hypothetical protein
VKFVVMASVLAGLLLAPPVAAAAEPPSVGPQQVVAAPGPDEEKFRTIMTSIFFSIESSETSKSGFQECPAGFRPISGGIDDTDNGSRFPIGESGPFTTSTGREGWRVQIYNPDHLSGSWLVRAVCDSGVVDYQVVEGAPVNVPAGRPETAVKASCADGRQALSGGWRTSVPEIASRESLPTPSEPGTSWLSVVHNFSSGAAAITPVAVCARVENYKQVFSDRVGVQPGEANRGFVLCPAGSRMAGGGYHGDTANMYATSSTPAADSWDAGHRSEDPQFRQMYVVAVCTS